MTSKLHHYPHAAGIGDELRTLIRYFSHPTIRGAIAQLGERIVRNDEVVGSSPTSSTIFPTT